MPHPIGSEARYAGHGGSSLPKADIEVKHSLSPDVDGTMAIMPANNPSKRRKTCRAPKQQRTPQKQLLLLEFFPWLRGIYQQPEARDLKASPADQDLNPFETAPDANQSKITDFWSRSAIPPKPRTLQEPRKNQLLRTQAPLSQFFSKASKPIGATPHNDVALDSMQARVFFHS